jgi:hypothetical protein
MPKVWECRGLLFGYSGNTAIKDPLELSVEDAP